jgi:hypothetical protein
MQQKTTQLGPVGRDFESLLTFLAPWVLHYEQITIENIREALKAHELDENTGEPAENLTPTRIVV